MKPSELLEAGLKQMNGGLAWTKDYYARGDDGLWAALNGSKAVKWCSYGVLLRQATTPAVHQAMKYLHQVIPGYNPVDSASFAVSSYNDDVERTWQDVEAMFVKGIELAKEKEVNAAV